MLPAGGYVVLVVELELELVVDSVEAVELVDELELVVLIVL